MKTIAAIHTAAPMVELTKKLFAEHIPDVRLINIADDSLIQDVIRDEAVTERTARRLLGRADAPAWCFVNVPMVDVSSSQIRERGDWGAEVLPE